MFPGNWAAHHTGNESQEISVTADQRWESFCLLLLVLVAPGIGLALENFFHIS